MITSTPPDTPALPDALPDASPSTSGSAVVHDARGDTVRTVVLTAEQRLNNRLYTHAMRGRDAEVLAALREGADLHDKDDNALRSAAGAGRLSTTRLLLDQGADLTARDHHALRLAAQGGHREVVALLLERGADLSALEFGALLAAVEHGRASTLTVLLNHADARGLTIPLEVLALADSGPPAGSATKHAAARDVLAPVLQAARVRHERQVLHAEVNAILRVDPTLPQDGAGERDGEDAVLAHRPMRRL